MTIATIDAIPPTTEPAIVALSDGLSPDPEFVDGDGVEDEDEDAALDCCKEKSIGCELACTF